MSAKKAVLAAALSLMAAPAVASDWSTADTKWEAAYLVLHAVDWRQTHFIATEPGHQEANRFLGPHPTNSEINRYFIATALLHVGVAYVLPPKARRVWQYLTIGIEAGTVARNFNFGGRIDF